MKYKEDIIQKLTENVNDIEMLVRLINTNNIHPNDIIERLNLIQRKTEFSIDRIELN